MTSVPGTSITTSWSVCPRPRWRSRISRPPISNDVWVGEDPVGRVDDDLGEVVRETRLLDRDGLLARLAGADHERDTALVAPDRRGSEDGIAEGVVEVAVRVDDDPDG